MALDLSARIAAANASPYAANAFSSGLTTEDYRQLRRQHGERVRWWKAMKGETTGSARTGLTYTLQDVAEDVRVLLFENDAEVELAEFGKIRVGDLRFSAMPDEIELGLDDRILAIDRTRIAQTKLTPSSEATDDLPHRHLASIEAVLGADGVTMDALDYELYGRAIRWRTGVPTTPVTVRYRFHPMYEMRGEGDRLAPLGSDGGRLPQIVPLHLVAAGNEYV